MDLEAIFKAVPPGRARLGVIGWPVEHSLSPAMHNAALQALGIGAVYRKVPVPPEEWDAFTARAGGVLAGFNVTVPYKEDVPRAPGAEAGDADARRTGAANTVEILPGGRWRLYNTDVAGFREDLAAEGIDAAGKTVVLLGAGGAARAALAALLDRTPARIFLWNRTAGKAAALRDSFAPWAGKTPLSVLDGPEAVRRALGGSALLVNATSIGLRAEDPCPVDGGWIHRGLAVYDMVYHRRTALLSAAEKAGARAVGGLGMLVRQGALSFKIWFKKDPPVDVMRRAAEEELRGRKPS